MNISNVRQKYLTAFSPLLTTTQTTSQKLCERAKWQRCWRPTPPPTTCLSSPPSVTFASLLTLSPRINHASDYSICQPVCLSDTYSHTTLTPLIPSNLTLSQLPFIISDCIVCCLSSLILVNPCSFSPLRLSHCTSLCFALHVFVSRCQNRMHRVLFSFEYFIARITCFPRLVFAFVRTIWVPTER